MVVQRCRHLHTKVFFNLAGAHEHIFKSRPKLTAAVAVITTKKTPSKFGFKEEIIKTLILSPNEKYLDSWNLELKLTSVMNDFLFIFLRLQTIV